MRLIGLIKHPVPGGPGEPQGKANAFYVAVRDKILGNPIWGQAARHAIFAARETIDPA
jgi:hypothetical protein